MSTSFKRVISHPEELGNLSKKMSLSNHEQSQQSSPSAFNVVTSGVKDDNENDAATSTTPAVVIENDEQQHEQQSSSPFRGVSTLSDEEEEEARVEEKEESSSRTSRALSARGEMRHDDSASLQESTHVVPTPPPPPVARTQRTGSGSSGTFGWFIDVHGAESERTTTSGKTEDTGEPPKSIRSKPKHSTNAHHHHGGNSNNDNDDYVEPTQFIDITQQSLDTANPSAMAVTAPNYILEENLSSQMLWKHTAGTRPPQPEEERAYFEMLWRQNFAMSSVDYNVPEEELIQGTSNSPFTDNHFGVSHRELSNYSLATDYMATDAEVAEAIERLHGGNIATMGGSSAGTAEGQIRKPQVVNKKVKGAGSNEDLTVLIKGDNVFGTTVSKSFDRVNANGNREVDTVNISVASYRVVESKKHGKYAQYLVIYREGSIRDTIGVWKRYSDFEALSRKVVESNDSCSSVLANMSPLAVTEEGDVEHLPNAITSWRLLKKRQRWFRCLDAGYLSLKVFLLERFLHDILFESSSPNLLRDFVIYDTSGSNK